MQLIWSADFILIYFYFSILFTSNWFLKMFVILYHTHYRIYTHICIWLHYQFFPAYAFSPWKLLLLYTYIIQKLFAGSPRPWEYKIKEIILHSFATLERKLFWTIVVFIKCKFVRILTETFLNFPQSRIYYCLIFSAKMFFFTFPWFLLFLFIN